MKSRILNTKDIIIYVIEVGKKYPLSLFIMIVLAVTTTLEFVYVPLCTKNIINAISNSNFFSSTSTIFNSALYLLGILFMNKAMLRVHGYVLYMRDMPNLKKDLLLQSLNSLLKKPYSYYQDEFSGALASRIAELGETTVELLELLFFSFLSKFFILIVSIIFLYQINIKFSIIMTLWGIFFSIIMSFFATKLVYNSKILSNQKNKVSGTVADVFLNILPIKLFYTHDYETRFISKELDNVVQKEKTMFRTNTYLFSLLSLGLLASQALNLYFLIKMHTQRAVTAGDFALVIGITSMFANILIELMRDITSFLKLLGKVQQVITITAEPQKIADRKQLNSLDLIKGEISFTAVYFKYPEDRDFSLNDVSFTIRGGEKVGIVGYSGAGKSTLVNLLLNLYDLQAGSITIDNQNIQTINPESLYKNISVITQDTTLFHRTILENIKYGNEYAAYADIIHACKKACIHEFIINTHRGYDTLVGERGIKLSGGQRQRIAIARAYLKNALILILDEATSQLDSITDREIHKSLLNLIGNRTTIFISHRLSALKDMDRILVLGNGRVLEYGSSEELLRQDGLYRKLWNAQNK